MALHLDIVTPEKTIFSGNITGVTLPTSEGEIEVLPHHTALVTSLAPGELRYQTGGGTESYAIGSGFAEITQTHVKVLTDAALNEAEIDEAATQAAIERAQKQLEDYAGSDPDEQARLQAVIAQASAQLRFKRRNK